MLTWMDECNGSRICKRDSRAVWFPTAPMVWPCPACRDTGTLTWPIQDVHTLCGLWQKECETAAWSPIDATMSTKERKDSPSHSLFILSTRLPKIKGPEFCFVNFLKKNKAPWTCDTPRAGISLLACFVVLSYRHLEQKQNKGPSCIGVIKTVFVSKIKRRKYCFDTRPAVFIACALSPQPHFRLNTVVPGLLCWQELSLWSSQRPACCVFSPPSGGNDGVTGWTDHETEEV